MKSTTVFSLLALAYATAVAAVPTPEPQGVWAIPAQEVDSNTLEARDPMMFGPKKKYPGEGGYKRDVEEVAEEEEGLDKRMMFGPKKKYPGEGGY